MKCQEFQEALNLAIESQMTPSTEIREHGTQCDNDLCAQLWLDYATLEMALSVWRAERAAALSGETVDFTASVLQRVLEENAIESAQVPSEIQATVRTVQDPVDFATTASSKPVRREKQNHSNGWFGVIASVVAMVCFALTFAMNRSGTDVAKNDAVDPIRELVEVKSPETTPEDEEQLRELGQTYVSLMNGASSRVTGTFASVIPGQGSAMSEDMGSDPDWINTWGEQLDSLEKKVDETLKSMVVDNMSI